MNFFEQKALNIDNQNITSNHTGWRLWGYGIANSIICIAFARRYPLLGFSDELLDIGKLAHYRVVPFIGFVIGIILLFVFYLLAIREARRSDSDNSRRVLFVCGIIQVSAMVWMYPVNAIDIFIYSVRSRLLTSYSVNPMVGFPADFSQDSYMHFASQEWMTHVSPYGPLWNLIAAPITYFGGDSIFAALIGFKILAAISALCCTWFIISIVASHRPSDATAAALLFLWNPLVLWEGIGNGHNDLVMLVPILGALYAWSRQRSAWVIPLLVAAASIKYVPVILLPLAATAIWIQTSNWRARLQVASWSFIGSITVLMVAFFPFYHLRAVQKSIEDQGQIFLTSPAAVVLVHIGGRFGEETTKLWLSRIGYGVVVIAVVWQCFRLIRRSTHLARASYEVLFIFLLIATWNFRNWYVIWLVALVALLPFGWCTARALTWSASALLIYGFYIWIWDWWGADFSTIQDIAVVFIFCLPVMLTIAEIIQYFRRANSSSPDTVIIERSVA